MARIIFSVTGEIAENRPGHVASLWGHEIHVASWRSHSATQRYPSSIALPADPDPADPDPANPDPAVEASRLLLMNQSNAS
jgi:hypothetical protein